MNDHVTTEIERRLASIESKQKAHLRWMLSFQAATIGILIGVTALLTSRIDRIDDRITRLDDRVGRLEVRTSGLEAEVAALPRRINQILQAVIAGSTQRPPVVPDKPDSPKP